MWSPMWSEQSVLAVAMAKMYSMFELKYYPNRDMYIITRHIESKDRCTYYWLDVDDRYSSEICVLGNEPRSSFILSTHSTTNSYLQSNDGNLMIEYIYVHAYVFKRTIKFVKKNLKSSECI